jgi:hypothetical protein
VAVVVILVTSSRSKVGMRHSSRLLQQHPSKPHSSARRQHPSKPLLRSQRQALMTLMMIFRSDLNAA